MAESQSNGTRILATWSFPMFAVFRLLFVTRLRELTESRAGGLRSRTDDLRHWSKFQGFCSFRRQAQRAQGRWATGKCVRGPGPRSLQCVRSGCAPSAFQVCECGARQLPRARQASLQRGGHKAAVPARAKLQVACCSTQPSVSSPDTWVTRTCHRNHGGHQSPDELMAQVADASVLANAAAAGCASGPTSSCAGRSAFSSMSARTAVRPAPPQGASPAWCGAAADAVL